MGLKVIAVRNTTESDEQLAIDFAGLTVFGVQPLSELYKEITFINADEFSADHPAPNNTPFVDYEALAETSKILSQILNLKFDDCQCTTKLSLAGEEIQVTLSQPLESYREENTKGYSVELQYTAKIDFDTQTLSDWSLQDSKLNHFYHDDLDSKKFYCEGHYSDDFTAAFDALGVLSGKFQSLMQSKLKALFNVDAEITQQVIIPYIESAVLY